MPNGQAVRQMGNTMLVPFSLGHGRRTPQPLYTLCICLRLLSNTWVLQVHGVILNKFIDGIQITLAASLTLKGVLAKESEWTYGSTTRTSHALGPCL